MMRSRPACSILVGMSCALYAAAAEFTAVAIAAAPQGSSADKAKSPAAASAWGLPYVSKTPVGWRVVGQSIEGRPILAATYGPGPRRVLVVGPLSGLEPEGVAAAELLAAHLQQRPPRGVEVTILRDINPDGHVRRVVGNSRGVDLERDLPRAASFTAEPAKPGAVPLAPPRQQSEVEFLATFVDTLRPDRIVWLATTTLRNKPTVQFSAPVQSSAPTQTASEVEDLARQVTLELPGKLLTAETVAGTLPAWISKTRNVPTLRLGINTAASAESVFEAARTGLLTAIGCGTPLPLPAVAWPAPQADAVPDRVANLVDPATGGPSAIAAPAPKSQALYRWGGAIDNGAAPLRYREIRHGSPIVPITRPPVDYAATRAATAAPSSPAANRMQPTGQLRAPTVPPIRELGTGLDARLPQSPIPASR
jgi:hypothetical protein